MGVGEAAEVNGNHEDEDDVSISLLPSLLAEFGSEGAAHVASDLLARANLVLEGGTRTPEEIVSRLVAKAGRPDPTDRVSRAVDFIVQLQRLAGPPESAFGRIGALLAEHELDPAPLREIERALALLPSYGVNRPEVVVDLSLGRGLRYYTGLVFELHADAVGGVSSQIGGGGRYDDLVRSLGGRDGVPACGFSFGLERLKLALDAEGSAPGGDRSVDVVVAPIEEADEMPAVAIATRLRQAGLDVELDVRRRGVKANLRHADREGVPYVVIVGERERQAGHAAPARHGLTQRAGARRRCARRGGEGRTMTAIAPLPSRRNQLRARRNGATVADPAHGAALEGHGAADARLPGALRHEGQSPEPAPVPGHDPGPGRRRGAVPAGRRTSSPRSPRAASTSASPATTWSASTSARTTAS